MPLDMSLDRQTVVKESNSAKILQVVRIVGKSKMTDLIVIYSCRTAPDDVIVTIAGCVTPSERNQHVLQNLTIVFSIEERSDHHGGIERSASVY